MIPKDFCRPLLYETEEFEELWSTIAVHHPMYEEEYWVLRDEHDDEDWCSQWTYKPFNWDSQEDFMNDGGMKLCKFQLPLIEEEIAIARKYLLMLEIWHWHTSNLIRDFE